MLHAHRLVYLLTPGPPDLIWEWQQPYIVHLLWNTRTFGCQVQQRSFVTWEALDHENTCIWETDYVPRLQYEAWPTWKADCKNTGCCW
jgi:hypothetical protein